MNRLRFSLDTITDKGILKRNNEDNILVRIDSIEDNQLGLFAICDGLGGLEKGEYASACTGDELIKWWNEELTEIFYEQDSELIIDKLNSELYKINKIIKDYGDFRSIRLGTTISLLIVKRYNYYIANVGDSRIYKFNHRLYQITEDHSLVNKLLKEKKIKSSDIAYFNKKNIITQCLGVRNNFEIYNNYGEIRRNDVFLLASDGFYNKIYFDEKIKLLKFFKIKGKSGSLKEYVSLVKERGEEDNISAIIVKCEEDKGRVINKLSKILYS